MTFTQQLNFIRPYFWPNKRSDLKFRLVLAMICLVLAKCSNLATPWLLGEMIDDLSQINEQSIWIIGSVGLILAYVVSRLFTSIFGEAREVLFTNVSQYAIRQLSLQTFEHLHHLPIDFHLSRHTGSLDRLIDRGTKAIDFLLRYIAFNIGPTVVELIVVTIIVWAMFGSNYALLLGLIILTYIGLTLRVTSWRLRFRREMNTADNTVAGLMVDSFMNVENVRLFNNEDYEVRRVDTGLASYEQAANKSRLSLMFLNLSQIFVVLSGVAIVLVMAAFEVQSGVLTIGGFVTLNTYMLQAFQPLNMLGWIYREIRQSLIDMENLFEVLEEKAEAKFFGQPKSDFKSSIRFENICFSYKKERPVLSQITFSLSKGETLAIVGETGGGKTTIGRLLLKTINPVSGDIFLGDTNVRTLDQSVVREAIGVVPQDSVLFNASLRHNIGYGCLGASDEEIMAASDVAGLKGFILGLPDGLDTEVGARGLKVSGGEKQRIAIARVVLKNPQILLFDEATSSLDTTTESQIQANLNFIAKDRTTLIIAHRLSTVIYADEILVLDKGIIVEAGSHSELLAEKNVYAQLWAKQTT